MAREFAALSEMELPPLPLEEWEGTKETLHRYCQIVGKTRMELSPFRNHCASLNGTSLAFRWNTNRSRTSSTSTSPKKASHAQSGKGGATITVTPL
jgi:Family of unknown function (DUF5996)